MPILFILYLTLWSINIISFSQFDLHFHAVHIIYCLHPVNKKNLFKNEYSCRICIERYCELFFKLIGKKAECVVRLNFLFKDDFKIINCLTNSIEFNPLISNLIGINSCNIRHKKRKNPLSLIQIRFNKI